MRETHLDSGEDKQHFIFATRFLFFSSTVEQMLKNTCTCPSIRWQRPAVISQDVSKRRFRTLWSTVELRIITETIYYDHKTQVSLCSVRLIKEVNDPELI